MKTSVVEVHAMQSVLSVDEVEKRIGEVPGVESVTLNYAAGNATVRYDETRLEIADIKSAVRQRGYDAAASAGEALGGDTPPGAPPANPAAAPAAGPAAAPEPMRAAPKPAPDPAGAAPHPLAQAVMRRAAKLKVVAPTGFKNIDGQGAQAQTAAGIVFLGNRLLMDTQKLALGPLEAEAARLQGEGRTVVHVAQNGKVIGLLAIADAVRPTAKAAVVKLRERGVQVVMLTGDNAGGALVDTAGHLIGINTAIYSRSGGSQGIGFAIPVSLARQVMEQIIATGRVSRGWLGVSARDATQQAKGAGAGAVLLDLLRGGPADKAGLRAGDTVVAIDGKEIADTAALVNQTAALRPGTRAPFKVLRGGEPMTITVELGQRPPARKQ